MQKVMFNRFQVKLLEAIAKRVKAKGNPALAVSAVGAMIGNGLLEEAYGPQAIAWIYQAAGLESPHGSRRGDVPLRTSHSCRLLNLLAMLVVLVLLLLRTRNPGQG